MESRDFKGYTVYEDGTVVSPFGKTVSPIIRETHGNRPTIRITENGKQKQIALSRLVYSVFKPEEFDITDQSIAIMQLDGDPTNCRIDNLYMVDRKEACRLGRITIPVEDKEKIQMMLNRGLNMIDVADIYGVTNTSMHYYCKRYGITKPMIIW